MWPNSWLVTTERDGYFAVCPSMRLNPGEDEFYAREQPLQTSACKSSQENKKSTVRSTGRPIARKCLAGRFDAGLNQVVNHFAAVNDWHRSAKRSEKCSVRIDAHQDRNCAQKIIDADRISCGCRGVFVGRSDHLPGLRAAAGKND